MFDIDELDFGENEYPDTVEPPATGGDFAPAPALAKPPQAVQPAGPALDNAEESSARRLAGQLLDSAEPLRERLLEVDARHAALPPAPDQPTPDARRVRFDSGTGDPASSSTASTGPQDNSQGAPKQARVSIFQDAPSRLTADPSADVSTVARHEVFEALSDQRICDALVRRAFRDNRTELLDRFEAPPNNVLVHFIAEIIRDLRTEEIDSPYFSDHGTPKGSDELLKHHPDAPLSEPEVNVAAKGGRRETPWKDVPSLDKSLFQNAAGNNWGAHTSNDACRVLSEDETQNVLDDLVCTDRLDLILDGRFVLTDRNDGLRTESNPLPVEASARLVFPGFHDPYHLDGNLRCDAPTGSRNSYVTHALRFRSFRPSRPPRCGGRPFCFPEG